jgi:hypothetical protein
MLYAKITPPLTGNSPFRVTEVTQWEAEARVWSLQIPLDPQRKDILILYFPECRHQDALDFIAWIHHRPILMDVMTTLEQDGILWKLWSLEPAPPVAAVVGGDVEIWDAAYAEAYPENFSRVTFPADLIKRSVKVDTDDLKFLRSMRIKWEDNEQVDRTQVQDQSGLHLVRPEDSSKQDPSSGSVR